MKIAPLALMALFLVAACDTPKESSAPASAASASPSSLAATATPAAASTASSASSASGAVEKEQPPAAGFTRFVVEMGGGTFLIDAPLEKIKGGSEEVRGHVDINAKDLAKTTGEIDLRMSTLKTSTFNDMDRDSAQTDHARNWMEVGNESSAESRMKFEWARFVVTSVDATPAALADAKEESGGRAVKAKVTGDLTLHGVTSKATVPVVVTFSGPADAPTQLALQTEQPLTLSLKEHEIKPRDKVGSFLNGALERIGKKIDDKVSVTFHAVAKPAMVPHP